MAHLGDLTAAEVKAKAKELGADLVGISPMDRWEGVDKQKDPRYIFPGAKSMIVFAFRIPRGSLRGVEEGTHFLNYQSMGYAALNQIYGPMVLWGMTQFMEDHGYEAVPMANINGGDAVNPVTGNFRKGWSRPVAPGKPYPDVSPDFRVAAYLAGLGEFGWSRVFLTPEFGPRQRFAIMLTDAELEPDPIFEGHICDHCMECVKNCHGGAIHPTETESFTLAGHTQTWGKHNECACAQSFRYGGLGEELNPFDGDYPRTFGYGRATEGSCGCVRACMVHLEAKKKLVREFREPFRKPDWKQWTIDHSKKPELEPWVEEALPGKIEDHDAYTNYNKKSNYGSARAAGLTEAYGVQPPEAVAPKKDEPASDGYNPLID